MQSPDSGVSLMVNRPWDQPINQNKYVPTFAGVHTVGFGRRRLSISCVLLVRFPDSELPERIRMFRAFVASWLVVIALSHVESAEPVSNGNAAPEWPEFRGPDGQGHSAAHNVPLTWTENQNIRWKAELPGLGWSSPVIAGDQIWLTTADVDPTVLRLLCVDRQSGEIARNVVVATPSETARVHRKNSLASPTPILTEDRVYVHFGPYATACLSVAGEILWNTALPHQQFYGPSSSPVLFRDLLIVPCLGTDVRYFVALDTQTGEERWKQSFEGRNAESTPLVIETDAGPQLISSQADRIVALDPTSGRGLWWVRQTNFAQDSTSGLRTWSRLRRRGLFRAGNLGDSPGRDG